MNVKCVALTRKRCQFGALYLTTISAMDQFRMLVHPSPHGRKNLDRWLRYGAITLRTDVEQVIAPIARTLQQITHDGFRRFPIVVATVEAPAVVHRHARFPRRGAGADLLFRRRKV